MKAFLETAGWADAEHHPLQGDASTRRYSRLTRAGQSAMLMQDPDGDVAVFSKLARHLVGIGLSAPRILAEDAAAGLLLVEDLGDRLIAKVSSSPEAERLHYICATDALVALHQHAPPEDLPVADARTLAQMTNVAFTHYAMRPEAAKPVAEVFEPILSEHGLPTDVMILRDYHAENILMLPDRKGPARAGLLDFQDAMTGHRAYDLISLLEDARRDVHPVTRDACIRHYVAATGVNRDAFDAAMHVLGTQRNLRILGVFTRLAANRGKLQYLDLIPRVWAHLQNDLAHPALAPLVPLICETVPEPTSGHLENLKSSCPTP